MIKELFGSYDATVDKLEMTDPENEEVVLADEVQTIYHALASQVLIPN